MEDRSNCSQAALVIILEDTNSFPPPQRTLHLPEGVSIFLTGRAYEVTIREGRYDDCNSAD